MRSAVPKVPAEDFPQLGRVLVVDDEPAVRRLFIRILSGAGWVVTTVSCAKAALDVLSPDADFAVLVTDVDMPGGSGLELARVVRERGICLPIVLVTGRPDSAEAFVRMDGNAWLVAKPFNGGVLTELLRSLLEAPSSTTRPVGG
jgi:CheY-like chemotaxis protein